MFRRKTAPMEAALAVVIQFLVAVLSVAAASTPSMSPSEHLSPATQRSPPVTLTINKCDQKQEMHPESPPLLGLLRASTNEDCRCPPGYESLRLNSSTPLCVSLRAPGPWKEACVGSGTATDYYDLAPAEITLVRDYLEARGVSACWISARRIAPRGALVRRLPGNRWNERIVLDTKKTSVTIGPEMHESLDQGCAAIGGTQFGQLTIRNCSQALHHLCVYRETALLRLHCRPTEFTTRYTALQQFCFSVREATSDSSNWPSSSTEYQLIDVTTLRRRKLREELLQKFVSSTHKLCYTPANTPQWAASSLQRLIKRAQNALTKPTSVSPEQFAPPEAAPENGCTVLQRFALEHSNEEMPIDDDSVDKVVTTPSMHLYFDKGRHKLFLTVYGGWTFWRERASDAGFGCYTNADVELIRRVKTSQLRKMRQHRHHTHRGVRGDGVDRADTDDDSDDESSDSNVRTMYEVQLVNSGSPGQYWCEAHLVPDFTRLVSQPILAYRQPDGKSFFSVTVELHVNRSNVASMRLSSYDRRIADHIKQHRAKQPALKSTFDSLKSVHVKRVDGTWAAAESDWHTVRLILHVVVKRIKSWRDFPAIPEMSTNEIELPEKYLYYYRMRWYLNSAFKSLSSSDFRFVGVNSTEYCLPDTLKVAPGGNIWRIARLGETVAPKNLCVVENTGLPITRRCLGDFLYGCAWEAEQQEADQCSRLQHPATRALFEYSTGQLNHSILSHVFRTVGDVLAVPANVLPADLFYISKTLENMRDVLVPEEGTSAQNDPTPLDVRDRTDEQYYCNITGIMNRLMYVNKTTVVRSQVALNTTNILLDAIETMVNGMAVANESTVLLHGAKYDCNEMSSASSSQGDGLMLARNDGTVLFRSPRLIVLIADPTVANISGMALFRNYRGSSDDYRTVADAHISEEQPEEDGDFSNYTIRYLYMNQSQNALFEESHLEIGSFIPQSVIENLGPLQAAMTKTDEEVDPDDSVPASGETPTSPTRQPPQLRVIVTIYYNDRAFRESKNGTIARTNAKIISVTIPGYGSRMPDEIPIYTRQHNPERASRCGYWSFDTDDDPAELGRWSYDECRLMNASASGELTLCGCYHLTSFSRLTMDTQMVETVGVSKKLIADQSTLALDVITVIGCSLSLLGVVGILVSAVLFPSWRVKASSKILLQLSCAIAVEMIIIFFEGPDIDKHRISTLDQIECTLLGSVFHYIILVTFMWMLVLAYLQFMRYVKVLGRLRPSHFILKATLCCWGMPCLPVVAFLIIDHKLYLKQDNFSDICYPHGNALYYGLLLPIGAIIFLNLISFVFVLYNIFTIPSNLTKTADHDMTLAQLRLSVFLFFLLGLPWIFGMLTSGSVDKLFAYLFCLTAPLQGFVLFVYFIIMDPIARRLWLRKLQRCPCVDRVDKQLDEKETTSPSTSFNTHL